MAVTAGSKTLNNVEAVRETLYEAMKSDDRTIILGEDVGARGNVFLITKDFINEFGPQRVIDTPIAEASIVGIAIGMAMEGLRPIAEIQFADFIYPAFNQIVGEAAKTRYRSNGEYTCPLVIRTPYGGGVRGALSHSVSIEALFYHVPGLKIVAPRIPGRHQRLAQRRDRRSRSGALPRTQENVSLDQRRGPRRPLHDSDRQSQRHQRRHAADGRLVRTLRALGARSGEAARERRHVGRGDRSALDPPDGPHDDPGQRREDAQAADHSRRQQVRRHRRRDFARWSPRRRSSRSTRRSAASAGPTFRRWATPNPLEHEFMSSPAKMAAAMREMVEF